MTPSPRFCLITRLARLARSTRPARVGLELGLQTADRFALSCLSPLVLLHQRGHQRGPCCRKVMSIIPPNPVFDSRQALLSVLRRSLGAGRRVVCASSREGLSFPSDPSSPNQRAAYACMCCALRQLARQPPPRLRWVAGAAYLPHSPTFSGWLVFYCGFMFCFSQAGRTEYSASQPCLVFLGTTRVGARI